MFQNVTCVYFQHALYVTVRFVIVLLKYITLDFRTYSLVEWTGVIKITVYIMQSSIRKRKIYSYKQYVLLIKNLEYVESRKTFLKACFFFDESKIRFFSLCLIDKWRFDIRIIPSAILVLAVII